jgi:hypothetical protein
MRAIYHPLRWSPAEALALLKDDAAANVNGRSFFVAGEEIGLWSEPELIRNLARPDGWDFDSLDSFVRDVMTADLTNPFLIEDPLKGDE